MYVNYLKEFRRRQRGLKVPDMPKFRIFAGKPKPVTPVLSTRKEVLVRFNEVDSLRMVWHGHYLRYFEDGREDFGDKHGLGYLHVYANGLVIPLVKAELDYKRPLRYGDTAIIETTYRDDPAAKLVFDYRVLNAKDGLEVCTGRTIQVFLNTEGELQLTLPAFFREWKLKMGLKGGL